MDRNNRTTVRMSVEEEEEIAALANEAGLRLSTYMRERSLNRVVARVDRDMIRQLVKIGNNINQLTRLAHIQGVSNVEAELQVCMMDLRVRVAELANAHEENTQG